MNQSTFRRELDMEASRMERVLSLLENGGLSPLNAKFLYPEFANALENSGTLNIQDFSILKLALNR